MRRFLLLSACLPLLTFGAAACGDPTGGFFDPLMVTDTVDIGAQGLAPAGTPSAFAVTVEVGVIEGPRFPERASDAERWDVAIAGQNGQIVFRAPRSFGFESRAAIGGPLVGRTFEDVRDVPSGTQFRTDESVEVQQGEVYIVRSREFSSGFGGCVQYAKVEPIAVDATDGTVRLVVATNSRCYDTRLANAGS